MPLCLGGYCIFWENFSAANRQYSPDAVTPAIPAVGFLEYQDGAQGKIKYAGVRMEKVGFRTVFLGFGFEGINEPSAQDSLLARTKRWFEEPKDRLAPANISDLSAKFLSNSNAIQLTWTEPGDDGDVGSATFYDLRYNNNPPGDTPKSWWKQANKDTNVPSPGAAGNYQSYQLVNLPSNENHYFIIRTMDDAGNVSGNSNIATTAYDPRIPNLIEPANETRNVQSNVTLLWSKIENAVSYHLQLSKTADFTRIILNQYAYNDTSYAVTDLSFSIFYYWRVRAIFANDSSAWSNTFNFRTIVVSPSVPLLVDPADNSSNVQPDITLRWREVQGADSYHLQVSTNDDFEQIITEKSALYDTTYEVKGLAYGTHFYWRVRTTNTAGVSNWSNVFRFTTVMASPATPIPVSPMDNAINVPTDVILRWTMVDGAESYHLQISTSTDFIELVADESSLTDTVYTAYDLMQNTIYYWRVQAINTGGASSWSNTYKFTTIVAVGILQIVTEIPDKFFLYQNYPNPFNASTTIQFALPKPSFITLKLFDILGKEVARLVDNELQPGEYKVVYKVADLPSGVYFYRIQTEGFVRTNKLMLLK